MRTWLAVSLLTPLLAACSSTPRASSEPAPAGVVIADTFTVESSILGETRRINVFTPTEYGEPFNGPLPVLYMLDGGVNEDFLHIAGLVQILSCNGGMRPHILVGVENTVRRRDLTGPTSSEEDRKAAPVNGGSAAFRTFLRDELMPRIAERYRPAPGAAVIGESLAGLFIAETLVEEPAMFRTYIAVDPSLWWNGGSLAEGASGRLRPGALAGASVFIATSGDAEQDPAATRLAEAARAAGASATLRPMHEETHRTIYHPAALLGLRATLPAPASTR